MKVDLSDESFIYLKNVITALSKQVGGKSGRVLKQLSKNLEKKEGVIKISKAQQEVIVFVCKSYLDLVVNSQHPDAEKIDLYFTDILNKIGVRNVA